MAKVLIVGAGAAGLMAAGAAVRQGHQVTVLEHTDKPGQKILVTGKGRCNLTNAAPVPELIRQFKGNGAFLNSAFAAFDNCCGRIINGTLVASNVETSLPSVTGVVQVVV